MLRFIERKANGLRELVMIMHTDPGFAADPPRASVKLLRRAPIAVPSEILFARRGPVGPQKLNSIATRSAWLYDGASMAMVYHRYLRRGEQPPEPDLDADALKAKKAAAGLRQKDQTPSRSRPSRQDLVFKPLFV